jgi:hypothetical protein
MTTTYPGSREDWNDTSTQKNNHAQKEREKRTEEILHGS